MKICTIVGQNNDFITPKGVVDLIPMIDNENRYILFLFDYHSKKGIFEMKTNLNVKQSLEIFSIWFNSSAPFQARNFLLCVPP